MTAKKKKHGGKRKGAGRPRSALTEDELAEIGKPPIGKPLALARWYQDAIAFLQWLDFEGRPVRKQLEAVRASASAAGRVLPTDIIYEAGKRLDRDQREMGQHAGGPALVSRKEDRVQKRTRAIRRDPA